VTAQRQAILAGHHDVEQNQIGHMLAQTCRASAALAAWFTVKPCRSR
jgi:hypothetical protein